VTGLVITPCGARKRAAMALAAQLYTGPYFTACLRYARCLQPDDRIRILSAKHGFVPLDRPLAPYNLRFGQPGTVTVAELWAQAEQQGLLDASPVVILGGADYSRRALELWPGADAPLSRVQGGMGSQLRALKAWTVEALVPPERTA